MENKRYKKEQDIHLTKEEYLAQLKKYLKRLPKEDYNNAMDYFTEYFEDAGSEGETSLMQELGTPKEAAYDILDNLISEKKKNPGTYRFVLDGKSMFLLRQYNYSTVDLIPSKVIGADTTWSKDEVYPSGIITKGANPHSAAGYNGYIYVGDYDLGTIGVVKYDKNVLTEEVSKSRNLMEDPPPPRPMRPRPPG